MSKSKKIPTILEVVEALRNLLEVVEGSNRTKRGDYFYERKEAHVILSKFPSLKDANNF